MYEFYYKYIGTKYNNSSRLIFTDTDSLLYTIETIDVYEDFYQDKKFFVFSEYSKYSKFFDPAD